MNNLIEKLFSKKIILHATMWLGIYVLPLIIMIFIGAKRSALYNVIYPISILPISIPRVSFIVLPLIAMFSGITYFMPVNVFKKWRLWTFLWLISFVGILIVAIKYPVYGNNKSYLYPDQHGFISIYILYTIISTFVILLSAIKEKSKK